MKLASKISLLHHRSHFCVTKLISLSVSSWRQNSTPACHNILLYAFLGFCFQRLVSPVSSLYILGGKILDFFEKTTKMFF